MIVEQCSYLLDSTAQAVRTKFVIHFEPQERGRKSILRHYRPAQGGSACETLPTRLRKSGNQCVSALARGLHHARPGIVLDAEAMPRSRKTILCRCAALGL